MNRIGLVTLYESDNYGTCLQAYALQKYINDLGYECEIINFNRYSKPNKISNLHIFISPMKALNIVLSKRFINARKKKFADFRKRNFHYSHNSYQSFRDIADNPPNYDAYVTGSDMVWSWESQEFLDYYFLKFANPGTKISYAPSFGNTDFTDKMKNYYKTAICQIDYCSCREKKGQEYIEQVLNKKCIMTVDPTMLISMNDWNKLVNVNVKRKKSALVYMFGNIPRYFKRNYAKLESQGYNIRYIPQEYIQYNHERKKGIYAFGPIEFLQSFHDADFVITNTYHGLMFSLIYEKPFVMLHRSKGEHWAMHEERMQSVLETLKLSYRYISLSDLILEKQLSLDYSLIRPILQKERQQSQDYLRHSLESALEVS